MSNTETPKTKPKLVDSFVALKVPEFRRFFIAALMSGTGSWLQGLATPYVMFKITDSAKWVGFAVFAMMLPMALVGPIAGPMADRVSRRRILITTQSLLILFAAGYATLWWTGVREPLAYLAVSIGFGLVNGFNMPAWQAYVADLVPRDILINAITLNSAQFNAARALGPMLGGIVLATLGPGWSFAGNAFSYLFVVGTLLSLPPTEPTDPTPQESPLRQFRQGWQYARGHAGILNIYLAVLALAVCGGTLAQVHLVVFAEEVFDASEVQFGLLVSAFGIGAVATTPLLTTVGTTIKRSRLLVFGLLFYGVAELVLTATSIYIVGLIGVFLAGSAHLTTATTTNSTLQLLVDERMRGRVMGMYLMVLTIMMPIGAVIQGPLDERFGPRPVVTVMGFILISAAVWLRLSGRALTADGALAEQPPPSPTPNTAQTREISTSVSE